MARLDIAERRLPQDGRIKLTVRGHEIDFRVSTIPSLHGEKVVLRVHDRTAVEFDYEKLGLPADIRQGIERALELPNGMVLVTGPTGSGKTTTLYTGLLKLNTVARNVVTVGIRSNTSSPASTRSRSSRRSGSILPVYCGRSCGKTPMSS
jgi:general secretion pathway protein E